jgi:hypothetical protein
MASYLIKTLVRPARLVLLPGLLATVLQEVD